MVVRVCIGLLSSDSKEPDDLVTSLYREEQEVLELLHGNRLSACSFSVFLSENLRSVWVPASNDSVHPLPVVRHCVHTSAHPNIDLPDLV